MEVLHLVVDCQTLSSVWRTLEQALASTSNSRIMQLHGSLQDLRQGDKSVTQFMQKVKSLFDELAAGGRPVSLEDFNLYVFRSLRGEFKDLVTSIVTKAKPLLYADLHSHLLTHKFLHETSLSSMRSDVINTPLLPTPNTPPAVFFSHCQSPRNFGYNKGRFHGGWRPNQFNINGHRPAASRPNFVIFADAYTKYIWYYHLVAKSDVYFVFHQLQTLVKRQFSLKIKSVQTDWGGE